MENMSNGNNGNGFYTTLAESLKEVKEELRSTKSQMGELSKEIQEDRIERVKGTTRMVMIESRLNAHQVKIEKANTALFESGMQQDIQSRKDKEKRFKSVITTLLIALILAVTGIAFEMYQAYSQGRLQSTGEKKQMIEDIAKEIVKQQKEQD